MSAGGVGGADGGLVIGEDAGFGEEIDGARFIFRGEVGGGGGLIAVERGEGLDDLGGAAMTVHVAEAADVHEDVETQGCAGVKGTKRFVVAATVAQAELDDFVDAGLGQLGYEIANLAVGVVGSGVKQRGGQLDFKRLGAFNENDEGRVGDGVAGE